MGNCVQKEMNENGYTITKVKGISKTCNKRNDDTVTTEEKNISIDDIINECINHNIPNLTNDNPNINNNEHIANITFQATGSRLCYLKSIDNESQLKETYRNFVIENRYKFSFVLLCKGYIHLNERITLIYPYINNTLSMLIENDSLDFTDKIVIMKNLILALKQLNDNLLSIENLSERNIQFYGKKFKLKITNIKYSTNSKKEIKELGQVLLKLFSSNNDYKNIQNLYIKAFIVGLVREDENELPSIDEIITIYNMLIEKLYESDKEKHNILLI